MFRQGDRGERFYLVADGEVKVERGQDGAAAFTKTLGQGEFFGEIALLKDVMRTATVTCLRQTTLLSMGKSEFDELLKNSLLTGARMESAARKRLSELGREVEALCL